MTRRTMRAVVVGRAGGPDVLELRDDWPRPPAEEGRVLIRVMAFGLNRGELFTRLGHSPTVRFPRVLGIECAGVVEAAPGTAFAPGQKVVATTGGMGRRRDGSYAEFVSAPAASVHAVETGLDWPSLAAVPEAFHTAWGALEPALGISAGETLLIRGGTSAVGLVAADWARVRGLEVLATSRGVAKQARMRAFGVRHAVVDGGRVAPAVREIAADGVDRMLDLVGTAALADSLACVRTGGTLCMAGILGGEWTLREFSPGEEIPSTTKFTWFSSEATPMDAGALRSYLEGLENGVYRNPLDKIFRLEDVREAHAWMEASRACGKIVISVDG